MGGTSKMSVMVGRLLCVGFVGGEKGKGENNVF